MDDRACLVALLEMLRRLEGMPHAWDIYAVANVNEEDSAVYVGALTSTYAIQPQIAICLDVTHGLQPGLSDEAAPGVSRGPCIARGANIHPFVFDKLRVVAEQGELKHQVTVYGGNTETNGWMMQVAGAGVATGLVELPLRYMHTSVETIHRDDVAGMAELLSAFAGTLDLEDASALEGERFVRGTARGESKKPARPTKRKIQRGKRKQPVVARRARRLKRRR
jgi:endoglucanase